LLPAESETVRFRIHVQFKIQGEGGCEKRRWALQSACILHVALSCLLFNAGGMCIVRWKMEMASGALSSCLISGMLVA
jgi:hypothetical protein